MRTIASTQGGLIGLGLLLGLPVLLATTACGSLGDRARDGCPTGEVCNPDTTSGLRFFGAGLAGTFANGPGATAVGGHQGIRFEDAASRDRVLPAHHVVSSNTAVLSADSTGTLDASLRGIAAGSGDIRVLDADERLIDRLSMSVAPIASVELIAADDLLIALADAETHAPVAFAAGEVRAGIALLSAGGARLVDDEMSVTSSAAITLPSWDTVRATFDHADIPLTVRAGGASFDLLARLAGPTDDLELVRSLLGSDMNGDPIVGAGDTVCVVLRSGGARVVGGTRAVTFRVDGTAVAADSSLRCVVLPSGLGASVDVEATEGSAVRTFTLPVEPTRRTTSMALVSDGAWVLPHSEPHALGARARSAWGLE